MLRINLSKIDQIFTFLAIHGFNCFPMALEVILSEVRKCKICEPSLALGANPILSASEKSKILVVGQAPGTRVHKTGIPWNDPSGDRLRSWMGLSKDEFYNTDNIAIVPMGFCYPGKGKSGDLPPRRECRETWHPKILPLLKNIKLNLIIGNYALEYFLQERKKKTLTETVKAWQEYFPDHIPLVHPSPRNIAWLQKNPWFEKDVIPIVRDSVSKALS